MEVRYANQLDERRQPTSAVKFQKGAMWEGYPWEIQCDCPCSESLKKGSHTKYPPEFKISDYAMLPGGPCNHARSVELVCYPTAFPDSYYWRLEWICPRVVVASNEGNYNSTGVCLDCILEQGD